MEGYASRTSVAPGDTIDFHVRAAAAQSHFSMQIFRRGLEDTPVKSCEGDAFVPGPQDDANLAINGCGWPPVLDCRTVVPAEWSSGYYVAILSSGNQEASIPFIVRSAAPATNANILAKISDTTSNAYNSWGGRGFYTTPFSPKISFDRPYDDLALFERYQLPFIRWAEKHGYGIDYCSSLDLHTNPVQLQNYRLFLSLGHDEYWSLEMRDQVEAFIASGGNVCFFSANTCFWQIRFDLSNGRRTMICYKEAEAGHAQDPDRGDSRRVTTEWNKPPVNRPENSMTGVSYRNGAGWWNDPIDPARRYRGYTVVNSSHWVLDGTGLSNGDTFGSGTDADSTILGYETDAVGGGTPGNFTVLAQADLRDWASGGQGGYATMGIYQRNGVVFTAATVNWAAGLSQNGDETPVDRITQNLIDTLSQNVPQAFALTNSGFENWENGTPAAWALDGAGAASAQDADGEMSSNNLRFRGTANNFCLKLDATAGETWITQSDLSLDPDTSYGAGCWIKASKPGVTIRLQTTDTWADFANAAHSGSGAWEYVFAVGSTPNTNASVPARVKLQVPAGVQASFDNVAVVATL
jgi:N,N-dimethylformamidase beta subunit-like protein